MAAGIFAHLILQIVSVVFLLFFKSSWARHKGSLPGLFQDSQFCVLLLCHIFYLISIEIGKELPSCDQEVPLSLSLRYAFRNFPARIFGSMFFLASSKENHAYESIS